MKSLKLNVFLNILKQCCNILIPLLTYPYVCRVLGAESLGKYSFAESVVQYFIIAASLGIPTYAVREGARIRNNPAEVTTLASELLTLNLLSLLLSYAFLFLSIYFVPRLQIDTILLYVLGINMITGVMGREWINTIYEDFLYITIRSVSLKIIALVLTLVFIKEPGDYVKYALINVVATSGGYILNFFYTQKYVPIRLTNRINFRNHIKPVLYLFCTSLTMTIYVQSDIIMLGFFCSNSDVGMYTLSSRVYFIIKTLMNAVIIVSIPRLSNYLGEGKKKEFNQLLNKLKNTICVFVFPAVIGLAFLSKDIIVAFGGDEYRSGYSTLSILNIAMIFSIFAVLYSQGVLVTAKKEHYFMRATMISAIVNIVLNIILIPYMGINGAAITTIIAEIIVYLLCKHYAKNDVILEKNKDWISIIIGCGVIAIICWFVKRLALTIAYDMILSVSLSCVGYFVTLIILKNSIVLEFTNYMSKVLRKHINR